MCLFKINWVWLTVNVKVGIRTCQNRDWKSSPKIFYNQISVARKHWNRILTKVCQNKINCVIIIAISMNSRNFSKSDIPGSNIKSFLLDVNYFFIAQNIARFYPLCSKQSHFMIFVILFMLQALYANRSQQNWKIKTLYKIEFCGTVLCITMNYVVWNSWKSKLKGNFLYHCSMKG